MLEFRAGEMTPGTDQMPSRLSRPFDLWRTTGVVSEGACMFVVEPEGTERRGYSYVAGYAFGNDKPDQLCGGLEVSAKLAIAAAGMKTTDIEALSAWGPGHKFVDAGEAQAMVRLFRDALAELPAVSIKGAIGAPLGAAPAIQVAAAILGHQTQSIPPTVNWQYPDPVCPLNLCSKTRLVDHHTTLLNAHGVGGVNASMVLKKC
jgi:3-oxoacyl-(acyl-carrier-protein) synthase